jgi:hypothetical protein
MSQLAFRCPSPSVIALGLLLLGAAGSVAAQEDPKVAPRARQGSGAVLRSEDLVRWGLVTVTKSGCHPTQFCPPSYASCAGWSGDSVCDASYCETESFCGDPWCDNGCDPDGGPANHTPYERFRVCFDQFGNPCTEWFSYAAVFCGC